MLFFQFGKFQKLSDRKIPKISNLDLEFTNLQNDPIFEIV